VLLYKDVELSNKAVCELTDKLKDSIYVELKDYLYSNKKNTNLYSKNYKCDIFLKTPYIETWLESIDSSIGFFLIGKCDKTLNIKEKYTDNDILVDNNTLTCQCGRKNKVWNILKSRDNEYTVLVCNNCNPFKKSNIQQDLDKMGKIIDGDIQQYSNIPIRNVLSEMLNADYDMCKDKEEKKQKTIECWNNLLQKEGIVDINPECDIIIKTLLDIPEQNTSNFYRSLKTTVKKEFLTYKDLNIFTFIKQIKLSIIEGKSEYVGNIDEVVEHRKLELLNKVQKSGQYGQYYILIFKDEHDNILKSFYNRDIGEINHSFITKFKILEHAEYNGVKQTKIKLMRIGELVAYD
jgi:hypothetical protein